jgi:glycine/D-amino acid oxidase-like deaminating enzyme
MTSTSHSRFDAIVVGGGLYGCSLGVFLAQQGHRTALLESEAGLLTRASYINQARVHHGYHYPRSFMTALRSAVNFPRFLLDFQSCIDTSFEAIYAIARDDTKVTAYQFERFCRQIGAPVRPAPAETQRLFEPSLIEAVFEVTEHAFNAARLRAAMGQRLSDSGVEVRCGETARRVAVLGDGTLEVETHDGGKLTARRVFNCTYAQVNQFLAASGIPPLRLKHELTEMALIEVPPALRGRGITVMDGPFFSTMPFPAEGLHTLSHVRYTPHESWLEPEQFRDPHAYLAARQPAPKCVYMLRDAQRFVPALSRARHVRSLFTVKTVLTQNEADDGRPILFRQHAELPGLITVLGGKIDNIYDVLAALNLLHESSGQAAAAQ